MSDEPKKAEKAKKLSTDEKVDLIIALLKANGLSLPEGLE